MSAYQYSLKCKLSYILFVGIVLISIFCTAMLHQLSVHMNEICEFKGCEAANSAVNYAVRCCQQNVESGDLLEIVRNDKGEIISVQTDSAAVNEIRADIVDCVTDKLSELENVPVKVPIGTLSGVTYLSGRGFDVNLRLHQIGAVRTEMKSEFVSAGVNQTKFRLYIDISVEMRAILPGSSTDINAGGEYLVSETVIVGDVPNMYVS